jgi:AcrR family transcriptional regulator
MSTSMRDRYHHGDLRSALIAAARDLLDEGGAGAVSLREAARRAGVSQTAPYRHFADKEALLAAVAAEGFVDLGAAMAAAAASGGPVLEGIGAAYVRFAVRQPARFRLMFGQGAAVIARHPDLLAAAKAAEERLTGAVSGRPGVDATAIRAWALVHGLASLIIDGMLPGQDPEALIATVLQPRPAL